jgi:hypothetical protein
LEPHPLDIPSSTYNFPKISIKSALFSKNKNSKPLLTGLDGHWAAACARTSPHAGPTESRQGRGRLHVGPTCHREQSKGWRLAADFSMAARPLGKPRALACSTHPGDSNVVPWAARVSSRWLTAGNGGRRRSVVAHRRARGTAACAESFYTISRVMRVLR